MSDKSLKLLFYASTSTMDCAASTGEGWNFWRWLEHIRHMSWKKCHSLEREAETNDTK